ncbi:MAG: FtsH protease activity modulator HflK [Alphaproteobacteria bacterium]|nr:MAG: FtsH protease activity modulator HflK [Alphaproteobacteria bacterium]
MPYGKNGGPWGGGDDRDKRPDRNNPWGGNRPAPGQVPDLDEIVRKGQEQLRVLMGGRGGSGGRRGGGGGPGIGRGGWFILAAVLVVGWLYMSVYRVLPEEQSVQLFLGEYTGAPQGEGLNFAPWPIVTYEKVAVTRERVIDIGQPEPGRRGARDAGLMLTGDENIVDIEFQVVWNIKDLGKFLFNLKDHEVTILAVAESAMREIIGRYELQPILNRDRGIISDEVHALIQSTLDSYDSGINIVRVNFDKADPPAEVIDAFRDVQAAEQERDRFQKEAERDANRRLAEARGQAAQLIQEAEAYRAQTVNEAEGEASRFRAILAEYLQAREVTRKRLYIETVERVLGGLDKIIIDQSATSAGPGVIPYLPLPELRREATR